MSNHAEPESAGERLEFTRSLNGVSIGAMTATPSYELRYDADN